MLQLLKVSGLSLWPLYEDGDYVLIAHLPLARLAGGIKAGDVLVFRHPDIGIMIKQVERILPGSGDIFVVGANERSLDSRNFGAISPQAVIGKVIWHIKRY